MRNLYFAFLGILAGCMTLPGAQSGQQTLRYEDYAYSDNIQTIRLVPISTEPADPAPPAVVRLNTEQLRLSFDDLSTQSKPLYARIYHCSARWERSTLNSLDYLSVYNEFQILDYSYSVGTSPAYVHYELVLPHVKLPGNYVVAVYYGDLPMLTKRFMVYEDRVILQQTDDLIGSGSIAQRNQQLNFIIRYRDNAIENPMSNVSVAIRQNQRWDNMQQGIKPSFVNENTKELTYRFFSEGSGGILRGGNEFRYFDIRSIQFTGQGVDAIDRSTRPIVVHLMQDRSRAGLTYAQQFPDINGGYLLSNIDHPDLLSSNYVQVEFKLASATQIDGEVYINGAMTNWNLTNRNRMVYDSINHVYRVSLLLRQGWYNYCYTVKSKTVEPGYFEGDYFQTENLYEILVYCRSFVPNADLLIGYAVLRENPR